jgi:hypothetical protein
VAEIQAIADTFGKSGWRDLVTSVWRKHLIICLFLGLLAIPMYLMDLASTRDSGGGNWITLDFRGLIFWTYIAFLAIDIVLSSIGVLSFPQAGMLRIHFCSVVLAVILLVTGFFVYGKLLRAAAISIRSTNTNRESAERLVLIPHGMYKESRGRGWSRRSRATRTEPGRVSLPRRAKQIEPIHETDSTLSTKTVP